MKKSEPLYVVVMNDQDLLAVIPAGKSVKHTVKSAIEAAGITDYSKIKFFLNCELRDEAFEGDAIVYRSKKTGDLVDVNGNTRLYAILSERF
jgi:hypothetical protein